MSSQAVPVPKAALECPQASLSCSRLLATPSEACSPRHPPPGPRPAAALGLQSVIKRLFLAGWGLGCSRQASSRCGGRELLCSRGLRAAPCGGFSCRARAPGDPWRLPYAGIEPRSPTLRAGSFPPEPPGKPRQAMVGGFFSTGPHGKSQALLLSCFYWGSPY